MLSLFGHVAKTAKQLQKTYCPISHELKTTKHWNLVNGENHTGNEAARLVPDLCLFFNSFIWGKGKWFAVQLQYISVALYLACSKS